MARILIVDDLPPQAALLQLVLQNAGYEQLTVEHNPYDALEHFKRETFDLILLDYDMPEMDGNALMKAMLEHQASCSECFTDAIIGLPIIMISASNDEEVRLHALSNGAKDFISKPFIKDEVISRVRNLLQIFKVQQKSVEAVRAANKAKDEFLAIMSHELRTPLTTIIGNAQIMVEGELNLDQQNLLGSIQHSGEHLLLMVNDILDLSKIESGKFEVDHAPYDLNALIRQVEQTFSTQAVANSNVSFNLVQDVFPEYQLLGDSKRINQILTNFLSNAFKFTEKGVITLQCRKEHDKIHYSVEDSGIGISPDVLERLFQPFEQADQSIARKYGGTGLGLYLCYKLAVQMDGTITVNSEEGKGSRFEVAFPYQESALGTLSPQGVSPATQPALRRFSGEVLIVEDNVELQMLISRFVTVTGAKTTVVSDGQQAVSMVLESDFDLILMDMQMPVMDGLEATHTLRSLGNETPIAGVSANVMQVHQEQFFEAGANVFISKPINRDELYSVLALYLKTETSEIQSGPIPNSVQAHVIDDEMMTVFTEASRANRVDIENALTEEDWSALRDTAHKIKGSGATFGYTDLSEAAKVLQSTIDINRLDQAAGLAVDLLSELDKILLP